MIRRLLYLAFLFATPLYAAERPEPMFRIPQGWSDVTDRAVKAITGDSYGFLWLGTETGVDRYDGFSVKPYTINDTDSREDLVVSIAEDGNGTLWIITKQGDYIYDRTMDRMTQDCPAMYSSFGIPHNAGFVAVDSDGNLWAESSGKLYCRVFKKEETLSFDISGCGNPISLSARGGISIILFDDGSFYRADPVRERIVHEGKVELSSYRWHYIFLDSDMDLWFYTAHSPIDGVRSYSLARKSWNRIQALDTLSDTIITTLTEDDNGDIWIGTENEGIYILDKQYSVLHHYSRSQNSRQLPNNHIKRFYLEHGNMWITLGNCGLTYAETNETVTKPFQVDSFEDLSSLVEDNAGNLWVGTDGDGIMRIDQDGKVSRFNKNAGNIASDIITCSLFDNNGVVWVGTYGEGILYYRDGSFHALKDWDAADSRIANIQSMAVDITGRIWVSTIAFGLFCIQPEEYRYVPFNGIAQSEVKGVVSQMTTDANGLLYLMTGREIIIYDCLEEHVVSIIGGECLHPGEDFTCLCTDSSGRLWIGMGKGLAIYDGASAGVKRIEEEYDIPSLPVTSIEEDSSGNIWIASGQFLIRIQGSVQEHTLSFKSFRLDDATFKNNVSLKASDGRCFFGSTSDIWSVKPETAVSAEAGNNHLLFTNFQLFDTPVSVGDGTGILSRNISETSHIRLRYNQNSFSLEMSIMNAVQSSKVHYEYRVNGPDGQWLPLQGNRIQMNALRPGKYMLEARATDHWGWSSNPIRMGITIVPPFWKSRVALALYILAAIFLLWVWYRKNRESQRLEQELQQQKELDEDKMRFFTNISHDLKSPLTLVISPLERMLSNPLGTPRQDIETAHRNAVILKEEIERMLDVRTLDAGAERVQLSHGDFAEFVKEIVFEYKGYVSSNGIHLTYESTIDSLEMDFDRQKVRRILMNLVSNSVKYNVKDGAVSVSLDLEGNDSVRIAVADTGIGINDADKDNIFNRFYQSERKSAQTGNGIGLHIVKEYVQLLNGTVSVEDNKPQGTRFTVTFPIRQTAATDSADVYQPPTEVDSMMAETRKKRILIVEDSTDLRSFLERCLSGPFETQTAGNGKEALKVLEAQDSDLVISDIMMPEMDGLELCRSIKNNIAFSHIPVILLTAKTTEKDIVEGLECGADEYIAKPFNIEILQLRIRKILEWTDRNHRRIRKGDGLEPKEITVSSLDEQLIARAIHIVEDNMDNGDFTVEDLSREVGMTRGHLYKKLMFIMGISPVQFIRIIRMKRGRSLMEQGWTNISDVAFAVGYSPKQFSRHFKETFGLVPSQFISSRDKSGGK